jgi:adenine-specific DNA-methyltransferase
VSRLSDLIRQAKQKDAQLGADLEREFKAISGRVPFGLNFERHRPEAVELPQRPVRRGDKVRVLPPRGSTRKGDQRLWRVVRVERAGGERKAHLALLRADPPQTQVVPVADCVVVAEFRDVIHPGLISTGRIERGGDKPFHTVINGENFHVLEALTYTHRGKVDCIYIDPPYNTGAKDWKYNNDYVEGDDLYRHSKWLAFMERRLVLAKELLDPKDSVLIVTIDEKEYLRLGLLLGQTFPEARIQMVSSVISSQASVRDGSFSRCNEYIYFVMLGPATVSRSEDDMLNEGLSSTKSQLWFQFVRTGKGNLRADRKGMFYPIFADPKDGRIVSVGDSIPLDAPTTSVPVPPGTIAVWPFTADGREGRWRTGPEAARARADKGLLRLAKSNKKSDGWSAMSVNSGTEDRIRAGEVVVDGREVNGSAFLREVWGNELRSPKTVWNKVSHNAGWHGSKLLGQLLPGRAFPYPKSLYAVEDALRFFVSTNSNAIALDFFAGSGTTAHALMRLNKQDGGRRQCISVTNNEVGPDEQARFRKAGLRPGDTDWEEQGICDHITRPRIEAAITGRTPDGGPVKGDYRFTDEFPMSEGFEENAEFFTLSYESPTAVIHNKAFERIAPLLWLRAGSRGRRIARVSQAGWDVSDAYGILWDLDKARQFCEAVASASRLSIAYIVTDDDRRYQSIVRRLPHDVEPLRLYESYLSNFRINTGE